MKIHEDTDNYLVFVRDMNIEQQCAVYDILDDLDIKYKQWTSDLLTLQAHTLGRFVLMVQCLKTIQVGLKGGLQRSILPSYKNLSEMMDKFERLTYRQFVLRMASLRGWLTETEELEMEIVNKTLVNMRENMQTRFRMEK